MKTKKTMPALDETTRTPGIKLRHRNEEKKEARREKKKDMDHLEEAQIRGLYHRPDGEKGIKK